MKIIKLKTRLRINQKSGDDFKIANIEQNESKNSTKFYLCITLVCLLNKLSLWNMLEKLNYS
jgi:hypothetical protein